jgi:hypothetical protein
MLKIDFYESGDGETIILTFPNGGMGIVDAHPSSFPGRPNILELIRGRTLHFVCLTHPHRDHGADLVPILENHPEIQAFWHTVSDVAVVAFTQQEAMNYPNYPGPSREAVVRLKKGWAEFVYDLYGAIAEKKIRWHQLRSDLRTETIDGVNITVLSPDEAIKDRFVKAYRKRLEKFNAELPDANLLSAVLALEYSGTVVLLGADALKENWRSATRLYFERELPKAMVFKVPHHGASNALQVNPARHEHNYLDICSCQPPAKSVLFAGDAKHPDPDLFRRLRARTDVTCISNGLRDGSRRANPLNIHIPGARAVSLPPVCNMVVSFSIDADGTLCQTAGTCTKECSAVRAAA